MIYHAKLKLTMWSRIRKRLPIGRHSSSGDLDIWLTLDNLCRTIPITEAHSSTTGLWEKVELTAHPTGQKR